MRVLLIISTLDLTTTKLLELISIISLQWYDNNDNLALSLSIYIYTHTYHGVVDIRGKVLYHLSSGC